MDTVYITGHRNPDSDSIISAMAYAALKNALGERQYVAARLGGVSDETQIILDRFHAQPPVLINNVRNQVRDLNFDTPPSLSPAASIAHALQSMQGAGNSALPVVNEDGTLYGMISAGDIASYDMSSVQDPHVTHVPVRANCSTTGANCATISPGPSPSPCPWDGKICSSPAPSILSCAAISRI